MTMYYTNDTFTGSVVSLRHIVCTTVLHDDADEEVIHKPHYARNARAYLPGALSTDAQHELQWNLPYNQNNGSQQLLVLD